MFADIDGSRIYYERHGRGPPLLMFHGGLVDTRSWTKQLELANEFSLILPDTRGFGQSEGKLTELTIADLAADAHGLLTQLGVDSTYVLGFSMGGMIAQHFALDHPDMVRGLILVSTRAGGSTPRATTGVAEVQAHVLRAISEGFRAQRRMAQRLYRHGHGKRGPWLARRAHGHGNRRAVGSGQEHLLPNPDPARAPGRLDPVHRGRGGTRAIKNSRLQILDDTGHTMQVERPDVFNTYLRDFIHGCEAERAGAAVQQGTAG